MQWGQVSLTPDERMRCGVSLWCRVLSDSINCSLIHIFTHLLTFQLTVGQCLRFTLNKAHLLSSRCLEALSLVLYTLRPSTYSPSPPEHMYTLVHTHAYTYTLLTETQKCTHTHAGTHACMHIRTHVHTQTHRHKHTFTEIQHTWVHTPTPSDSV